jgi:hypothetical protein
LFLWGIASHSLDRVPTDVDVHEAALGRPHIPEQGLLQVPWLRPCPPEPRSIRKAMEGREEDIIRVRPGFEPYLVRLAHHCRIVVGCELGAPWTPERVA